MRRLLPTLALCLLIAAASAFASAPNPENQVRLDSTIRYLQNVQQASGGFAGAGEPGQISSAWTALALAAAGINPRDQARPGGVDAFSFLVSHFQQGVAEELCAPEVCTTTYERELMVVNAAGASPHDFAGIDLVEKLLARERPDGSFPHVPGGQAGVNDTIFAILALAPVAEPAAQAPIQRAAEWVEAQQRGDGSWSWKDRETPGEVDMTGAAIQALAAAGRGGSGAVQKGIAYLHDAQAPDGGFPALPGELESNAASTAWAVQAIWAVGESPEAWLTGSGGQSEEPLDFMASLQEPDGHIRWKRSDDTNGVWMTAFVAPAFAGQTWPIPAAPRALELPPAQKPGNGGEGTQQGEGVIAGGGGAGAPLFSRPKPQSKGKTPGGARVVRGKPRAPRNHSKSRRGDNTVQPTATATTEADDAQASVDGGAGLSDGGSSSASGAGASSSGAAPGAGSGEYDSPAARALAARGGQQGAGSGRQVTGTVIGASAGNPEQGTLFGAPGLHGAGIDADGTPWAAIAIGGVALLLGLGGAQLERRRGEALA